MLLRISLTPGWVWFDNQHCELILATQEQMSKMHFERRQSLTCLENESQVAVVPARFWHLSLMYAQVQREARASHFSAWLLNVEKQFFILASMLGIVVFGRIKLSGASLQPALLRVAKTKNMAVDHTFLMVGHTLLIKHHDHMEVAVCVVTEEYRRHGIGKILIDDAIALAGDLPVIASCMPKSHAMCMLFKKCGFVEIKQFSPAQTGHIGLRHWQYSSNGRQSIS